MTIPSKYGAGQVSQKEDFEYEWNLSEHIDRSQKLILHRWSKEIYVQ